MFRRLKERSPSAAAIVSILFGPVIGMLYISRGKLALEYLLVSLLAIISPFLAAHYDILIANPETLANILGLIIQITGAFHCYSIAKKGIGSRKWCAHSYILILIFIMPFLLAIGLREGFYKPYHIPSSSMSPIINPGDYLFADLRAYDHRLPQRGDVIIFYPSTHPSIAFIKRIIGVPGNHVQLKDNIVYINNVPLADQRAGTFYLNSGVSVPRFAETLPEKKEFDILKQSAKSMTSNTQIYDIPPDHYFVLGDNRDQSRDSRFNDIGYVSVQNIIGKAGPVLWNSKTYKFSCKPVN